MREKLLIVFILLFAVALQAGAVDGIFTNIKSTTLRTTTGTITAGKFNNISTQQLKATTATLGNVTATDSNVTPTVQSAINVVNTAFVNYTTTFHDYTKTIQVADVVAKGPMVDVRAFANFSTAVNDASTVGKTILITDDVECHNMTVPSNRNIVFVNGSIDQDSCVINTLSAPRTKVFVGTGTVTGLKEAYPEMWTSNDVPGTTDMEDAWNKATAAATVVNGLGIYAVSDTVLVGTGRKLTGNFTLKAITGLANKPVVLVKEGDGTAVTWGVDIGEGVTIDGNDIALTGIETYYSRDCKFRPTKITRVNKYGIILGNTGAAAVSTDSHIYDTTIWFHESGDPVLKTAAYANPSDSIGVYHRNCTDSRVVNTTAVGFRVGFETSATSGAINFTNAHAWNRRAHGPLLAAFRSYGSTGTYTQCYADTPNNWYSANGTTYTQDAAITAVYGFYIDSFSQAIVNSKVYMNPSVTYGATDELLTAVHFTKAEYGHIFGLQIQGGHADYQYNYIYGGTTTNATIMGTGIPISGTLKNTTSVFDQVGLRKVNFAPTMLAVDGAAATVRELEVSTAGVPRIRIGGNATAEAGSNVGTDFNIRVYDDAGNIKYAPVTITRSTGYLTFSRVPIYADNAAALTGGLTEGQVYRTSAGVLMWTDAP